MKNKFWIEDEYGNVCFNGKLFNSYDDGWNFLYCKFPVIQLADGSTDDQEDELGSYFVVNE
jgi:hypothetical protein